MAVSKKSGASNSKSSKPKSSPYVEKINYWSKGKKKNDLPDFLEDKDKIPENVEVVGDVKIFDHTREDVLDDGAEKAVQEIESKVKEEVLVESFEPEVVQPESALPEQDKNKTESESKPLEPNKEELNIQSIIKSETMPKKQSKLPGFLSKITLENNSKPETSQAFYLDSKEGSRVPTELKQKEELVESKNSFTSIFQKEQDEISSIRRVFRKSIVFMAIALFGFGLTSLTASTFLWSNWLLVLISSLAFVILTNIFFIIVAHRTYIWLFLLGELILLVITQGVQMHTLIVGITIVLLTYLAYLDLEKIQLGSRIFSVPYVIGECTKLLTTVVILTIALSVGNQVYNKGVDVFIADNFLANRTIMAQVVRPFTQNFTLKSVLANQDKNPDYQTVRQIVCLEKDLDCNNPKIASRNILTEEQFAAIDADCKLNKTPEEDCNVRKVEAENTTLVGYIKDVFPGLNLSLKDRITDNNYREVLNVYYRTKIKNYVQTTDFKFLPSALNKNTIYPLSLALMVFIFLSIVRFLFVWLVFLLTWITWKILQFAGFVRIDVEMVEAEIVGI
ncbi:MAG: hypothetical protein OHK0017_13830 [Patescibacteria group bacterium]